MSPAWRRYSVTRLALAQRAHLRGELAERGIDCRCVIVADDGNLDIAAEFGFDTVEQDNTQIGRKFNDGIEYAANHDADFIAVVGSDDWLHPDLFDRLPREFADPPSPNDEQRLVMWDDNAPEALTGRRISLVDLAAGCMRICEARGSYGVIPWLFPRRALDPSGFRPVNDAQMRGIDGSLLAGLKIKPEWMFCDPHDVARVDFKSDVNLNAYAAITWAIGVGDELSPWDALAERYPAHLVAMAQETHQALVYA